MSETKRTNTDVITVGSAELYINEYTGTLPAMETREDLMALCKEESHYGSTYEGAAVTYTKETTTIKSDNGKLRRNILTSDELKVKLGIFGWNGDSMAKLESTASVEVLEGGLRRTKIGGLANADGRSYLCVLHHVDKECGDCWWVFVGTNTSGFEFNYKNGEGAKVEPEFTATSMDKEGRLGYFFEEIAAASLAG